MKCKRPFDRFPAQFGGHGGYSHICPECIRLSGPWHTHRRHMVAVTAGQ